MVRAMNMPRPIFIYAFSFILLGVGAYLRTGMQSKTALIPAVFGVLMAGAGAWSLKSLKHGGHAAALIGLLGFLGTAKSLFKISQLYAGTLERPAAVMAQAAFAILCFACVVLCVRSFIDARRAKS
jgi:thiol:disulfide interchange protein